MLAFGAAAGGRVVGVTTVAGMTTPPPWAELAELSEGGFDSAEADTGAARLLPVSGLKGLTPVIAPTMACVAAGDDVCSITSRFATGVTTGEVVVV